MYVWLDRASNEFREHCQMAQITREHRPQCSRYQCYLHIISIHDSRHQNVEREDQRKKLKMAMSDRQNANADYGNCCYLCNDYYCVNHFDSLVSVCVIVDYLSLVLLTTTERSAAFALL